MAPCAMPQCPGARSRACAAVTLLVEEEGASKKKGLHKRSSRRRWTPLPDARSAPGGGARRRSGSSARTFGGVCLCSCALSSCLGQVASSGVGVWFSPPPRLGIPSRGGAWFCAVFPGAGGRAALVFDRLLVPSGASHRRSPESGESVGKG